MPERAQINNRCAEVILLLSVLALVTVLTGYLQSPQPDEGIGAHIFQLSIVLEVPAILVFLVTMDWKQPLRAARRLAIPGIALMLAFSALYYLENVFYHRH